MSPTHLSNTLVTHKLSIGGFVAEIRAILPTSYPAEPILVRVHVKNPLSDVLGIKREDFGLPLRLAMTEIAREGKGLVLVLGGHEDDEDLLRLIQKEPEASVLSGGDSRESSELRTYGIGAQIIFDMGIRKMRVLSAPKRMTGLAGFGLEVVEYVESEPAGASDEESPE